MSPVKIKKQNIVINDLQKFTKANIYHILSLPFEKNTFMQSKECCDYLEVYEEECHLVQSILKQYEPVSNICNVIYTDKLLWLSADKLLWLSVQTILMFIKEKKEDVVVETSPRRKAICMETRNNIHINAERMKDSHNNKKRLFVKIFQSL